MQEAARLPDHGAYRRRVRADAAPGMQQERVREVESASLARGCRCVPRSAAAAQDYRARLPQDEVIYFLLPDRFENGDAGERSRRLEGDRLKTGFDPTHKGFYHGGDLKGLTERLDYIQGMGATAVWLAPVFKNKPVQGPPGRKAPAITAIG